MTTDNQNELFDVVDENDKVIGKARRGEVHKNKKLIHRSIGVIVFNTKGEVFLQKRSVTKDIDPNRWTIAASGHVVAGDSYEETVIRELKEELGIDLKFPLSLDAQKKVINHNLRVLPLAYPNNDPCFAGTQLLGSPRSCHPLINNNVESKKANYFQIVPVSRYICRAPRETEMVMLYKTIYDGSFKLNKEEIAQGKFFTRKELQEAVQKQKIELSFSGKMALAKIGWISPLDKKKEVG